MPRPKEYIAKQVSFAKGSKEDMALYKWLTRLPHGEFTNQTKEYWTKKMKGEEQK